MDAQDEKQEEKKSDEDGDEILLEAADDDAMFDKDSGETDTFVGDVEMSSSVHMSVYQIYNENVNDLLGKNVAANLKTR